MTAPSGVAKALLYYIERNVSTVKPQFTVPLFKLTGLCSGFIYASQAADWRSIPGSGKLASHQRAEDAHYLAWKINPHTASLVLQYGLAQGYRKGDENLRLSCDINLHFFASLFTVPSIYWAFSLSPKRPGK